MNRPTCTVKGSPVPGGLCSRVVVGMCDCGALPGSCAYQGPAATSTGRQPSAPQLQRLPPTTPEARAVVARLKGWITPGPRKCIACGALVRPGQSEACPHE